MKNEKPSSPPAYRVLNPPPVWVDSSLPFSQWLLSPSHNFSLYPGSLSTFSLYGTFVLVGLDALCGLKYVIQSTNECFIPGHLSIQLWWIIHPLHPTGILIRNACSMKQKRKRF
ncbi:hypothetical protein CK203_016530 [Vitis vinifera]|uniref:Uncharacterized protein n=1 Tax=Vitis vinifera TaxID=29760 RepID=A0A438E3C6_VITVI|nr:hypothetical protein CK203_094604 [Vitis vinifera]RVX02706.1 hypothetical protein CK203_016530 [Vitis vinifera]